MQQAVAQIAFHANILKVSRLPKEILYTFLVKSDIITVKQELCRKRKGCDFMLATKPQIENEKEDVSKLELYRLIGEGYKAMQEGKESTLESVKERISKRRAERV